MSEHQFALLDRLSMIEHLLGQLAELYSKHDPVKVISLAGKTIQDAEMFKRLVDHWHLSQTLDVGSRFMMKLEKSIGVSRSSLKEE
nr:hypothetical protein [Tanacetum cinerariifolium]